MSGSQTGVETLLAGTTKSRSMSKDMPSTCTLCCDSMKTSCTFDIAAPSKGEIAVIIFPLGGVTAATIRAFMSGGNRFESGRLYSK